MTIKPLDLLANHGNKIVDSLLLLLISFSIIGFLTLKGATNTSLYVLLVLSLFFINKSIKNLKISKQYLLIGTVIFTFSLPITAIFLSQLGRQDWLFRSFDGPSRIFLSIPIFFLFIYKKFNYSLIIGIASPIAIALLAFIVYLHPEIVSKELGRFATPFVRPIVFGSYALVLTSFCLFHIDTTLKSSKLWLFYQFSGLALGSYLVIGSGTRGCWIAVPFIAFIWLFFNYRRINKTFISIFILLFLTLITALFFFPPDFDNRYLTGFYEINSWLTNANINTPAGYRLSMWKMVWQLFLREPFFGYGEKGFIPLMNEPWLNASAAEYAKQTLICCGAHNEFFSNILRSGVFGGISVIGLFYIPLFIFFKHASHHSLKVAQAAQLGLAYITCIIICSISIEVFNLKYLSSFYGLTIAGLIAQIVTERNQNTP